MDKMKYTKKKTKKFMRKAKTLFPVSDPNIPNPPMIRQFIFAEKPLILRRRRSERFEDLAALHKTECIWCTKEEHMVAVQVCFHKCVKKDHCRRYQNYMNGCDKDGNSLL